MTTCLTCQSCVTPACVSPVTEAAPVHLAVVQSQPALLPPPSCPPVPQQFPGPRLPLSDCLAHWMEAPLILCVSVGMHSARVCNYTRYLMDCSYSLTWNHLTSMWHEFLKKLLAMSLYSGLYTCLGSVQTAVGSPMNFHPLRGCGTCTGNLCYREGEEGGKGGMGWWSKNNAWVCSVRMDSRREHMCNLLGSAKGLSPLTPLQFTRNVQRNKHEWQLYEYNTTTEDFCSVPLGLPWRCVSGGGLEGRCTSNSSKLTIRQSVASCFSFGA